MKLDYNLIAREVDEIRKTMIQGDYDGAHQMIERCTKEEFSAELEFEKVFLLTFNGEFEKADSLLNDLLDSATVKNMKSRLFICDTLHMTLSFFRGNITELKPMMESIEIYIEEIQVDDYHYFWKAVFLMMKSIVYFTSYQFEIGLKFHLDAEELIAEYHDKYFSSKFVLALIYINMGEIYRNLGKLGDSLEYLEKSRRIMIDNKISYAIGGTYANLGATYSELGESEIAIKYYEESLNDQVIMTIPMYLSLYSFRLFYLYLLTDNSKKTGELQEKLKDLSEENPKEIFYRQTSNLMDALLLMKQNRRKSKVQAQNIIEQLINTNNLWFEFQNISKILLIQLLLEEYADFEEDVILEEANTLIEQLKKQAEDNGSKLLSGELSILESKISLITKNIDKANSILENAKTKAQTEKFVLLQNKIEYELRQLEQLVVKWQEFASIESTIKQRLEQVEIQRYLEKMVKEYK